MRLNFPRNTSRASPTVRAANARRVLKVVAFRSDEKAEQDTSRVSSASGCPVSPILRVLKNESGDQQAALPSHDLIPGSKGLPFLGETLEFYVKGSMRFALDRWVGIFHTWTHQILCQSYYPAPLPVL
jgi:hypothetical protein